MNIAKAKQNKKNIRRARVRAKISGTASRPRLSVFKSLKHLYAQLINDTVGQTLAAANDLEIKKSDKNKKTDLATAVGELLAKKALEKNITNCVFDKGSYKYHGRIKAVADGARSGGLKF